MDNKNMFQTDEALLQNNQIVYEKGRRFARILIIGYYLLFTMNILIQLAANLGSFLDVFLDFLLLLIIQSVLAYLLYRGKQAGKILYLIRAVLNLISCFYYILAADILISSVLNTIAILWSVAVLLILMKSKSLAYFMECERGM